MMTAQRIVRSQAKWTAADFRRVWDEMFEVVNADFLRTAERIGGEPKLSDSDWRRLDQIEARAKFAREMNSMPNYVAAWKDYAVTARKIFDSLTAENVKGK